MKKLFAVIAAFSMMIFVSCGDNGKTVENDDNVNVDENQETDNETLNDETVDDTEAQDNEVTEETDNENPDEVDDIQTTDDDGIITQTCTTEGDSRIGSTVCGSTGKGKLYQNCTDGIWVDSAKCTCDPGNYPEVCGDYAQKMWFTASSKVATINMAEAWTRTYFYIVQEQDGNLIHIKAKICNIKIDNTKSYLLEMQMPQSFADALPLLPKESTLVDNGDGTYGFTQDVSWEIRSIDPNCYGTNPGGYTLPGKSTDSCVQDWDKDGIPGLYVKTAGTMSGYVHIVEKSSSKFENGWFAADGQTSGGDIIWTDEQEVLQASSASLEMGAENQLKATSDEFTGSANFFEQFKIPDGSNCAYVVDNAATIFNPDPVNID
ncbi:MAG TPA: hypothetical protein PKG52_04160 [bacterium]|nr:hypothetical protein [bacterium]HPS29817.1 hypothetical protein [bacterium]